MHFFVKYFLMFLFFCFVGWVIESLYCSIGPVITKKKDHFEFINRGFLSGPVVPIYGVCSMLMVATLLPFKDSFIALFFMGILVCDVVEYVTSFLMEKLFHARWWDYTGYFLNLNGRICFRNSIIWGALAIIFIKGIYPGVNFLFDLVLEKLSWEGVIGLTFLGLGFFLMDLWRTVVASLDIRILHKKADKLRDALIANGEELREDIQKNYVEDLRDSFNHMTNWQRHRIHRMITQYPQFMEHIQKTREELSGERDITALLTELQFFKMNIDTFFANEKREMY